MRLDKAPNSAQKLVKKATKHSLWLLVALLTGITFVGYFYPIRELATDLATFNLVDGWTLFWIGFFTLATYLNAGWMREQVCLYMCPYARFQSVMFDSDTLIVSYDERRGEPRGSRKRDANYQEQGLGDCVDCGMCVQVCPTGIDIRDGLQYECIGCALCIDACDSIMDKMDYPKGLISYTTEKKLEGKKTSRLHPRALIYGVLLTGMIAIFTAIIVQRVPLELDVIKDRGSLFQMTGMGLIENSYTLKIMNMSDQARTFTISVSGLEGLRLNSPNEVDILPGEIYSLPTIVEIPPTMMERSQYDIEFHVQAKDDPALRTSSESRFLGTPE